MAGHGPLPIRYTDIGGPAFEKAQPIWEFPHDSWMATFGFGSPQLRLAQWLGVYA